jgi:hypothetical protein
MVTKQLREDLRNKWNEALTTKDDVKCEELLKEIELGCKILRRETNTEVFYQLIKKERE